MKIVKEKDIDAAYIHLRKGKIVKTVEIKSGLLVDLDKKGEVIGIEVLSMSKLAPLLVKNSAIKSS